MTRRLSEGDRFVRTGDWARRGIGTAAMGGSILGGKVLGIIGYGRIAKMVEARARAFGLEVIHTKSSPHDHPGYRSLDELLATSDFSVVLVPLTPDTRHLINAERLAKMKRGAFSSCRPRQRVMDEAAVVAALQSGHLAGAAFDVYEEEPIVNEALFTMDNVVLTPHNRRGDPRTAPARATRGLRRNRALPQGRERWFPVC